MVTGWDDAAAADAFTAFDAELWWRAGYHYLPEELAVEAGQRVLDVGCGPGAVARWLARTCDVRVFGLDRSPAMLGRAAREADDARVSFHRLRHGTLVRLLPQGSVDAAVAAFVYECEPRWAELVELTRGVFRSLRPAGRFVLLAGNPDTTGTLFEGLRQGEPGVSYRPGDDLPVDMRRHDGTWERIWDVFWDRDSYERLLREAGFRVLHHRSPVVAAAGAAPFLLVTAERPG
ncbi:class I SAM-dependent methyltransferase [Salinifilum aidingensis]